MKQFKILLLIFCVLLSSKLSYAQSKVKCTNCKNGIATWSETVSCTNCKSWADSYRNIKGCDVCKNNKVISIRKQGKCTVCKGTTWRVPVRPAPLTKEQQIIKRLKDLNLDPIRHSGTILIGEETQIEVTKYKIQYDYSKNNLWYLLGAIMTNEVPYGQYKDRVYALLDYYGLMFSVTKVVPGYPPFYPSPTEVSIIKSELEELNNNPDYSPHFFGGGVTAEDIIIYY